MSQLNLDPLDITPEIPFLKNIVWLKFSLFGNSLYDYSVSGIIFVILAMMIVSRQLLLAKLANAAHLEVNGPAAFVRGILLKLSPFALFLVAFYIASKRLVIPSAIEKTISVVTVIVVTVQTVRIVNEMVTYAIKRARSLKGATNTTVGNMSDNMSALARAGVWTAGILFMLDNLGFNVSTFVAGLGIGGAALALASQAILGDTFSSFAIALDRPFTVGDFIVVDTLCGTVEHIGLKTTRVRSLSGELLIFSNSDLTKSRICNFQQMSRRRCLMSLGVIYQTSPEIVRKIPEMLKQAVDSQPLTQFDRAHFKSFGQSSLNFEVVFFVLSPEYNKFMDIQQAINFNLLETFKAVGIEFAYPTQTVFLQK
jgi:small-conductance mechanosensitive channel